jgi:alkanesulfonate monooxygenase SsuD/methylene tetrahydromethanopterin reductase-like flavin-dependent oxidoreductase (luciferase family)
VQFGIFDQNDRGLLPPQDHLEARLRLVARYDALGFDRYHVSEHHATPLSCTPATGAWLGAVASRTRRIRFGPLVCILPLRHPLQVAEEVALLDQISGGRFDLGVGRGISPFELGYHGVNAAASPAMYREALDLLLMAMTQDSVTFEGRWWRCEDVPIVLRPKQQPHPPLWYACATPEAAVWPARNAVNIVCNAPAARVAEIVARYRAEWAAAGRPGGALPRLGLSRAVVIAETTAEAMAAAQRGWRRYEDSFHKLWRKHGSGPVNARVGPDFAETQAAGMGFAGTPAEVRDALLKQVEATGVNYLVSRFAFGDLTEAESRRSAELFAREVMPALRERRRAVVAAE